MGITMPIGLFDPLGFSNGASAEALQWYREAELKHGRVAMAAFVGFLVNYQGITFPADLTMSGEKFSSLGTGNPLLAWDNISDKGKWSILGFIGLLEVLGEVEAPLHARRQVRHARPRLVLRLEVPVGQDGGAEAAQPDGRDQQRPPRDDRHHGFHRRVDGAGLGPVLHGGPHAVLRLGLGAVLNVALPCVLPPKNAAVWSHQWRL